MIFQQGLHIYSLIYRKHVFSTNLVFCDIKCAPTIVDNIEANLLNLRNTVYQSHTKFL